MKGRQRQVQCITTGIGGHHLVPDVRLHDLGNSRLDGQERQAMNKGQPLRAALWYVSGQLVQYGRAGDQFVSFSGVFPPLPRPIPSCHDIRSGAPFHVEAGDRSLNVDARFGHGHTIPYFARKGTE